MNKKVLDLLKQAGLESPDFPFDEFGVPHELEKLVELIVRECAAVASNADLSDVEGGDGCVLQAAADQIKQHFDIK